MECGWPTLHKRPEGISTLARHKLESKLAIALFKQDSQKYFRSEYSAVKHSVVFIVFYEIFKGLFIAKPQIKRKSVGRLICTAKINTLFKIVFFNAFTGYG